jgi:hypothetical protein
MMFMFALTYGGACTFPSEHIDVISGSVVEAEGSTYLIWLSGGSGGKIVDVVTKLTQYYITYT